jgi:L-iditol 2-dehydrogenase/galactitol-1-phosphate 5-dehydrogenase
MVNQNPSKINTYAEICQETPGLRLSSRKNRFKLLSMKSVVLTANGSLSLEERPLPESLGENSILVKLAAAGVCGSDIPRAFENGAYHYPLVLGHELSGIVEEPGNSRSFARGDRVVIFPLLPDPSDPFVQIGELAVSAGYDYFGSRRDGGFQEYLQVPEGNLLRIPEEVGLLEASMTEPAAVALHGVSKLTIPVSATALVIGGGPIGLMVAQWLRIRGASRVIVAEPDERKRPVAEGLDFETIDPRRRETVEAVREITGGRGAECVVEACGLPVTFRQALASAATFGQVVFLGNIHGNLELTEKEVSTILRRELTIRGTWNSKITPVGRSEWDEVLLRLRRELRVGPLISHTPALEEAPETLRAMFEKSFWFNKVIIDVAGVAGSLERTQP